MLIVSLASKDLIDERGKSCKAVVWDNYRFDSDYGYRIDISYDVEYSYPDPVTDEAVTKTQIHTAKSTDLTVGDAPEGKTHRENVLEKIDELLVNELGFDATNVYGSSWSGRLTEPENWQRSYSLTSNTLENFVIQGQGGANG